MNYIKTTINLPIQRNQVSDRIYVKLDWLRKYLFKLGCFDVDWMWAKIPIADMRKSDIVIDLTENSKYVTVAQRTGALYISAPLSMLKENDPLVSGLLLQAVTARYTKPSAINSSKKLPTLYHLSFNKYLPIKLEPRQPDGGDEYSDSDALTAENLPERVSFSSSLEGCFRAIYPNILDIVDKAKGRPLAMSIYAASSKTEATAMLSPADLTKERLVHDACFTSEYVFFKNVYIRKVADVIIHVPRNPASEKITYKMFGGIVEGPDTGWAPDIRYEIIRNPGAAFVTLDKFDFNVQKRGTT